MLNDIKDKSISFWVGLKELAVPLLSVGSMIAFLLVEPWLKINHPQILHYFMMSLVGGFLTFLVGLSIYSIYKVGQDTRDLKKRGIK